MLSQAPDERRAALDARILAWMAEPWRARSEGADDERFDAIARELFAFQREHCLPYRRFCEARGISADAISSWRDLPAVPTGAFKEVELRSFPKSLTCRTFRTSGTTSSRRGTLELDTLALYEASLLPTLRRYLFPDVSGRTTVRILAPSPVELPDSSLSHMFGVLIAELGDAQSGFDVLGGKLRVKHLLDRLRLAEESDRPVALCGTALAFAHLLDALRTESRAATRLAPGSRIMETGGFKGSSRLLSAEELYGALEERLGVPALRIVNQYGMTELGSQFYDSVLLEPDAPRRKLGPPWVRVRIVHPETGGEVAPGEVGMIAICDLANTGSIAAIQTADLGRRISAEGRADGFEVLGRSPGAEARGCSLAADLMLGGSA